MDKKFELRRNVGERNFSERIESRKVCCIVKIFILVSVILNTN